MSRAAAERIVAIGRSAIAAHGRFDWLLSGGNTPVRTYEILARQYNDQQFWRKTRFYWADERCVGPDHPDSNFRIAALSLIQPLGVPAENVYRVPTESGDPDRMALQYEAILPERPDLVLLGVGEDGHTASLFPGSAAVEETGRRVVAAIGFGRPTAQRITITPAVLKAARSILVLAAGRQKAEAVRLALAAEGDVRATPARLVRDALWLVDREAAAQLPKSLCSAWPNCLAPKKD